MIGQTGLQVPDTSNPTLRFLADIGFLMLMFSVGMNIPLDDDRVRASLGRGAVAAGAVAILAAGAGVLVSMMRARMSVPPRPLRRDRRTQPRRPSLRSFPKQRFGPARLAGGKGRP
ncbi:MAG: hypothetical protein JO325_05370 [Solirubrobacterales bacterium]|nr:hypothetical protein [Solirubrobacterales bacterium]